MTLGNLINVLDCNTKICKITIQHNHEIEREYTPNLEILDYQETKLFNMFEKRYNVLNVHCIGKNKLSIELWYGDKYK